MRGWRGNPELAEVADYLLEVVDLAPSGGDELDPDGEARDQERERFRASSRPRAQCHAARAIDSCGSSLSFPTVLVEVARGHSCTAPQDYAAARNEVTVKPPMRPPKLRRRALLGAATTLGLLVSCRAQSPSTPPSPLGAWRYDVEVPPDGRILSVSATIAIDSPGKLVVDDDTRPYVTAVVVDHGRQQGDAITWDPPRCEVHYRFRLDDAARELHDPDAVAAFENAYVTPGSAWLLHPLDASAADLSISVRSAGPRFLSAIPPARGNLSDRYETHGASLDESPLFGIGAWRVQTAHVADAAVTVGLAPSERAMSDDAVTAWIADSLAVVTRYLRGSPVEHPLVLVVPDTGTTINGKTLGGGGGSILLELGRSVTPEHASESWVLVHELIHLELPRVGPPHEWLGEGLATYVEPIARARAGKLSVEHVWSDWLTQGKTGLPEKGDEGLERTHTWGRTYWGGAIFCLEADVEIRKRTGQSPVARRRPSGHRVGKLRGRRSMDDRSFSRHGRSSDRGPRAPRALRSFGALAPGSGRPRCAVARSSASPFEGGRVVFDDRAPLAHLRRAMTIPQGPLALAPPGRPGRTVSRGLCVRGAGRCARRVARHERRKDCGVLPGGRGARSIQKNEVSSVVPPHGAHSGFRDVLRISRRVRDARAQVIGGDRAPLSHDDALGGRQPAQRLRDCARHVRVVARGSSPRRRAPARKCPREVVVDGKENIGVVVGNHHRLDADLNRGCPDPLDHDVSRSVVAAGPPDRVHAGHEVRVQDGARRRISAAIPVDVSVRFVEALEDQVIPIALEGGGNLRPHRSDLGGYLRLIGRGKGILARVVEEDPLPVGIVVRVDDRIHARLVRPGRDLLHLGHPRRVDRVRGGRADVVRPGHGDSHRVGIPLPGLPEPSLASSRDSPQLVSGRVGVERVSQIPAGETWP